MQISSFLKQFIASSILQGEKILTALLTFSFTNSAAYPSIPAHIGLPSAAYSNNLEGRTLKSLIIIKMKNKISAS